MPQWYYSVQDKQLGPIEESQLRSMIASGQVAPQDLIWADGMPAWTPAWQALPGSAPVIAQAAAPFAPYAAPVAPGVGAPIQLQYAAPTITAAPVIEPDAGPFYKIASMFTLPNSNRWVGVCVASPRAFYLLKIRRQNNAYAYGVGGLAGILLASALSKADDTRTCDITDLPPNIRAAVDPKGKRKNGDVIVIPKNAVNLVKPGAAFSRFTIQIGMEKFFITRSMFSAGKARNFLAGTGWVLDQEVIPTAPPMHGEALGRPFSEVGKQGPGTAKRVIYGVLGVALIIIIVLLRAFGH